MPTHESSEQLAVQSGGVGEAIGEFGCEEFAVYGGSRARKGKDTDWGWSTGRYQSRDVHLAFDELVTGFKVLETEGSTSSQDLQDRVCVVQGRMDVDPEGGGLSSSNATVSLLSGGPSTRSLEPGSILTGRRYGPVGVHFVPDPTPPDESWWAPTPRSRTGRLSFDCDEKSDCPKELPVEYNGVSTRMTKLPPSRFDINENEYTLDHASSRSLSSTGGYHAITRKKVWRPLVDNPPHSCLMILPVKSKRHKGAGGNSSGSTGD